MADSDDEAAQEAERLQRRKQLSQQIQKIYEKCNFTNILPVTLRNILIIGRTRTGKSTIKDLLIEPTKVQSAITMVSETKGPVFKSFVLPDAQLLLNIIDTPGVFERGSRAELIRSDEAIMEAIVECVNLELTKFHLVCFAFSTTAGIQRDDMDALKLFMDRLGPDVSQNSCLIITRCESKTHTQCETLRQQLLADTQFKAIAGYFKQGIFFTGTINYDDFSLGNESVITQFKTILKYRENLIKKFSEDIKPFHISKSCIGEINRIQAEFQRKIDNLERENSTKEDKLKEIDKIKKEKYAAEKNVINKKHNDGCTIS